MIKALGVAVLAAAVLIGADRAAGTYWALPYALGCFIAVFGLDRLLIWRGRAVFAVRQRDRMRRRRAA